MADNPHSLLSRRRFTFLLCSLVFVQLVPVVIGIPEHSLMNLLWLAVLLTAVYAASGDRKVTITFALVALIGFSGRLVNVFAPGSRLEDPIRAGDAAFAALFIGMTVYIILRAIVRADRVTVDTVAGAICVYLLIGLMWANFYALVELADPGSFRFPDTMEARAAHAAPEYSFGYYSFVTLTTLGYGDITPVTFRARTLSWMEAVLGVVFMATAIAFLVAQVLADTQDGREL